MVLSKDFQAWLGIFFRLDSIQPQSWKVSGPMRGLIMFASTGEIYWNGRSA